jgi:hypothetical protein
MGAGKDGAKLFLAGVAAVGIGTSWPARIDVRDDGEAIKKPLPL